MDVVQPELVWVNNKCYRFFESTGWSASSELTSYIEDNYQPSYKETESCNMDIDIFPFKESKFKHTFSCPKPFHRIIVGTKGAMVKKLRAETATAIDISKTSTDITIIGDTEEAVVSARHRIDLIMESAKPRLRPTHFLSIPLTSDIIIAMFDKFKNDVLNDNESIARGIEEALFQKSFKLHITIVTLLLLTGDDVQHAVKLLSDCKEDIIDPILEKNGPVTIKIKGIECMNDDPTNVKVLYAKINTTDNILQTIADKIADRYSESGLVKDKKEHVKLHMTLMNTKFKADNEYWNAERKVSRWSPGTFDASSIMKTQSETAFGETVLKEIHLSRLGTAIDSYYDAEDIMPVPYEFA